MRKHTSRKKLWQRQEGGVAVEFALLLIFLASLVFGAIDFGHAWYMKQVMINASREGARYGSRYEFKNHIRVKPNALTPSISSWVKSQYESLLPSDAEMVVTPGGTGYTTGLAGDDLSVTITATKRWFVLGNLIPGWGPSVPLSSTTVMKVE